MRYVVGGPDKKVTQARAVLKGLDLHGGAGRDLCAAGGERRGKDHGAGMHRGPAAARMAARCCGVVARPGIQLQSASLPAHIRPMEAVRAVCKMEPERRPDAAMLDDTGHPGPGMKKTQYGAAVHRTKAAAASCTCAAPEGRTWYFWMNPQPGWTWRGGWRSTRRSRALQAQGKTIRPGQP